MKLKPNQQTGIDTVRMANHGDIAAIVKLVNAAYRPEAEPVGWTHESDLVSGSRTDAEQISAMLARPDSVILVGLIATEIIACVHIEKVGNDSHIGMLAVSPVLQGVGAGKYLLNQAERYASVNFASEKCVLVVLSSRIELMAFYLRRHYVKTGIFKAYPLSAGVGTPKLADLKLEVLEKRCAIAGR